VPPEAMTALAGKLRSKSSITANKDILAGFSSQGPTNVDLAVKPDLTSVGVNVLSSIHMRRQIRHLPGETVPARAFFRPAPPCRRRTLPAQPAVLRGSSPGLVRPARIKSSLRPTEQIWL